MTASTAPITLPGKHRQEAPQWGVHLAIALLAYRFALAGWAVRSVAAAIGWGYVVLAAFAIAILALALAGLLAR